jgi:TonB family protein
MTVRGVLLGSLILSLFVHFLFFEAAVHAPPLYLANAPDKVEVEIVDKPKEQRARSTKEKVIVRQALPPLDQLVPGPPPADTKYLSERDQHVRKETQAKNPGMTKNRSHQMAKNAGTPNGSSMGEPQEKKQPEEPGAGPSEHRLSALGQKLFNTAPSTSGEYLPDVAEGPITALNSERFLYYSFFARIEERIRPLWERNVQDTHERLPIRLQKNLEARDWVTGLEILLSPKGDYVKTIVQRSSGITAIDHDAVDAFAEAAYFPNPPKEMVEDDGHIHLKYVFVVQQTSAINLARPSTQ